MVNSFIEKIIVHEADRSTGKREQRVDIHLNFIGNFVPPDIEIPLTPKEVAKLQAQAEEEARIAHEKREHQLAKQREKNRKYRDRERNSDNYDEILAQRRAEYAERRNAKIAQAIAEGKTSPRRYKPQKKYQSAI